MKYTFVVYTAVVMFGMSILAMISGCQENGRYVDPDSGRTLSLVKDANTGLMVDETTRKPVYIYVDTETKDTVYGSTGKVINGQVKLVDGKYKYEDYKAEAADGEYKIKNGDYKMEVEKDGDITIKDGDKKTKIEGETGEVKKKND
jgi:hypothetical protein